jgi:serine/threonine protein kinase
MPRIPENPLPAHHHLLADFLLNELLGLHSGSRPYELWWVQPHPLDTPLDLTGRARFSTMWPDMTIGEAPLSDILLRILTLGGHVNLVCEPFSQAFTRSDVLAGPEALVNRLRLAFSETFQAHTVPKIALGQSAWIGRWGAVVGSALAFPDAIGGDCRYIADPVELDHLRAKCHTLAEGRATAFPELSRRHITTGELDVMRSIIRGGGRYVDVERLPQHTPRSLLYRATDTLAGDETVAIKVMLEPPQSAEQARLREAVARRLGHPNVVRIYDPETFSLDDGRPVFAIVMEYMPGGSLKDELERKGQLTLRRAIEIAIQACHGLAYAHEQGIVHRDVKPGNILLGAQGEAKIADFNIAKVPEISGDTWPGQPLGTFQYIPPEQVEHAHQATSKADVYSLGCVLFEMLVGRPPFLADSDRELASHHQQTPPPSLRAYRIDVPEALEVLIHRCLAKEPEVRPTADELAEALKSMLAQLATEGV